MVKWGSFQDQYLHLMQVTASLDNKNIQIWALLDKKKKKKKKKKINYYSSYGHMVKWSPFQDQYLHPMQVTTLMDQKLQRYEYF